jgi:hypothetical protein
LLFANFQKDSGDTSENGKRVLDNSMQIRIIACSYLTPLHNLQEGNGEPFENISVCGYIFERFCMWSPLVICVEPLALASPLEEI